MPTVICWQCNKPWMDTKHRKCPNCGASPEPPEAESLHQGAGPTWQDRAGPMTYAQAERILKILEQRPGQRRVSVGTKAAGASDLLAVLAALSLALGVVLGAVALIAVFVGDAPLYYLSLLLAAALYTALTWGLLTTASVVAGYVANRSE